MIILLRCFFGLWLYVGLFLIAKGTGFKFADPAMVAIGCSIVSGAWAGTLNFRRERG